jgi:hypothetical protein
VGVGVGVRVVDGYVCGGVRMRRCTLVGEIWEMSSSAIFFRMVVFPALSKLEGETERGREGERERASIFGGQLSCRKTVDRNHTMPPSCATLMITEQL